MSEQRYFLRGEIDLATAPQLRADLRALVAGSGAHLLVDCRYLDFIDSQGIAVLLEVKNDLETAGRHMLLVNVPDGGRMVLHALGLDDLQRTDRIADLRSA